MPVPLTYPTLLALNTSRIVERARILNRALKAANVWGLHEAHREAEKVESPAYVVFIYVVQPPLALRILDYQAMWYHISFLLYCAISILDVKKMACLQFTLTMSP